MRRLLVPGKYQIPKPANIPDFIKRPPHHISKLIPEIYSHQEAGKIRSSAMIAASTRSLVDQLFTKPMSTHEIDLSCQKYIISRNAYPSGIGFHGFPRATCTSVNEVVAHGIPDERILSESDVVNVDITCFYNGYFGDCSTNYCLAPDQNTKNMMESVKTLVLRTIEFIRPGMSLYEIAACMDTVKKELRIEYKTVNYFCGHFIGDTLHSKPDVMHSIIGLDSVTISNMKSFKLKPGHVFTIEPILVEEGTEGDLWPDGWTVVTKDKGITVQHEEMVLITENGAEILTIADDKDPIKLIHIS
jgi:methionyl aminopeptidase